MGCQSEVLIGDNLVFSICTHDPETGILSDADGAPAYRVYENEAAPPLLTGTMAKLDDANTTGFYSEEIACTAANGFDDGKSYTIYIEATVDGDTGGIAYSFRGKAKLLEGALSYDEFYRILLAALAGKSNGGGTDTVTFRDLANGKDRITATVDADGNRTAITLNGAP